MANRVNHPKIPIEKRFWTKVNVRGDGECWPWMASRHKQGYGLIGDSNGGIAKAHRIAYSLSKGSIPNGKSVLHRCDNPPCCNPDHLFLGTQLDNMRDAKRKGRMRFPAIANGENNAASKLCADAVKQIRSIGCSLPQRKIAERFGVTQTLIGKVLRREIWGHVA